MIKAKFLENSAHELRSVEISGHAASGEYGYDVVCAAVSALSISFYNGVESIAGYEMTLDVADGYMKVIDLDDVKPDQKEKSQILFLGFLNAMQNVAENNPQYVETELSDS
ncbi:ribosomal-processing cysteine protease Prp [Lactococcus insecticola]|uniref:Ribosomal processing cysteine protease Prp n=1 Tax=Pseudolactococcus insecticola TaxID=2709158 RepID=A0A6A0B7Y2_9LACT|nr:ribosomal-processing cysteine protease Prp [Lactococcus insecticola]GFH41016.1 hypothetical protein Hs20B_14140 [Lactococcus insecticola]